VASFIIVLTSESFCLYALDRLSPFCNWRVLLLDSKFQAMIEALSLTPRCRCKKPLSAVLTSEARWRRCVRRCPHKSRSMSYRRDSSEFIVNYSPKPPEDDKQGRSIDNPAVDPSRRRGSSPAQQPGNAYFTTKPKCCLILQLHK
jgi:hypothetical protein